MDRFTDELQKTKVANRLQSSEKRISEIDSKINKVINQKEIDTLGWDWTNSYENWNNYEDLEELYSQKDNESKNLKNIIASSTADNLGHYHDHSKEKNFFESPENHKFKLCERNRIVGNYLFKEGLLEKALEHYKIAITYYEYCFPEDGENQAQLDTLRHACLCNTSLCYIKLGSYRIAIENTNIVLSETNNTHEKALFRRAQANRLLDEYSLALDDLKLILLSNPNDKSVQEEIQTVQILQKSYNKTIKSFAQTCLNNDVNELKRNLIITNNNEANNNNKYEDWSPTILNEFMPLEPIMPKNLSIWEHSYS